MKFLRRIILITILIILLIYISSITNIPDSVLLFKGENLNLKTALGITIKQEESYKTVQTSVKVNKEPIVEKKILKVSLLNLFNIKEVEVNEIPQTEVIPLGNTIGLKLYTNGVLVIGMTEIQGEKPYKNSNIKEGDLIIQVNSKPIETTDDLIKRVNESKGEKIELTYLREGVKHTTNIEPVQTEENEYKIGLWVRDGAVGVGTITYYEPTTNSFAALGHPIVDNDTGDIVSIKEGELLQASISSIKKGEEGNPGEIRGTLKNEEIIGKIRTNTKYGIFGTLNSITSLNINSGNSLKVALRDETKTGKAKILLTLEDGIRKEYEIQIKKIYKNNNEDNKSMLIQITDEKLKEITGGIIQGMSGAPIVQNGKFIRSNNTRTSKRSNNRVCSIWRFNDKTNESSIPIIMS